METTLRDWFGSFWAILIHPSEKIFIVEAQKAEGKTSSAWGWLLLITVFIHVYTYAVYHYVFPIQVIILTILLIPLDAFFLAFCLDMICRRVFHRKNTHYQEFLYLVVVILVAYYVLTFLLELIPVVRNSSLLWVSYVYPIALLIIAVKSLTKLKGWQATVAVVLSVTLAVAGLACMPIFLLSLIRAVPNPG